MLDSTHTSVREWLNKLESSDYDPSVVTECLISLKESTTSANTELLTERIIQKADDEWLSSSYSQLLLVAVLTKLPPHINLMSLSSFLINNDNRGSLTKSESVISVYEKVFTDGHCFRRLLLEESVHVGNKLIWKKLASIVTSLPDTVANHYENKKSSRLFHHEHFYVYLATEMVWVLEELVRGAPSQNISTELFALMLGQLCISGKAKLLLRILLPYLVCQTHKGFLLRRIIHKLFESIPDRCFESFVIPLLQLCPSRHVMHTLLNDVIMKKNKAKLVILHKCLLTRYFTKLDILRISFNLLQIPAVTS